MIILNIITRCCMNPMCYFCRREQAESQCSICKRWVCIQCSDCHNCYPRD